MGLNPVHQKEHDSVVNIYANDDVKIDSNLKPISSPFSLRKLTLRISQRGITAAENGRKRRMCTSEDVQKASK